MNKNCFELIINRLIRVTVQSNILKLYGANNHEKSSFYIKKYCLQTKQKSQCSAKYKV